MKRLMRLLPVLLLIILVAADAWADDVLYCRMCGKSIPPDSKFCCYCGEAVVKTDDAAPEAQPSLKTVVIAEPAADVKTAVPGPFNTVSTQQATKARVSLTKSPTSESVPYGGSAIFIARALNATGITWYIANGDASTIYNVSDAPNNISGLTVYGQGSETLTLCGIPSWLNGWKVQACFSGEGGPIYSDAAYIWTYQQAVTYCEPVFYEVEPWGPCWNSWQDTCPPPMPPQSAGLPPMDNPLPAPPGGVQPMPNTAPLPPAPWAGGPPPCPPW